MGSCIITDRYDVPKSWDDLDTQWLEYGDYAGWVDAIRAAMMERVDVCLNGIWGSSQLQTLVNGLGYFQRGTYSNNPTGYRGDCEVYEFARDTEVLLNRLLTPEDEYGTDANLYSPWGEEGYFLDQDPDYWLKRTTYPDDTSETGQSTMCYAKFLNLERMFEDDERNYQLALSGVAKGDTIDKFVPFFNAVKNALNYMTVVPVAGAYEVDARTGAWPTGCRTVDEVLSAMREHYNDEIGPQPQPNSLADASFRSNLEHFCRITNYADETSVNDSFTGRMRYKYTYPYQIVQKLPPRRFNYYYAYWAERLPDEADENIFTWSGGEYSPGHLLIGTIDEVGHFLGGDSGPHFGVKFPSDGLIFPSTPGRQRSNLAGYILTYYHIADFNVDGGFNFRPSN